VGTLVTVLHLVVVKNEVTGRSIHLAKRLESVDHAAIGDFVELPEIGKRSVVCWVDRDMARAVQEVVLGAIPAGDQVENVVSMLRDGDWAVVHEQHDGQVLLPQYEVATAPGVAGSQPEE
jgi:phosphoglycerate dehydrogenase-like enzyme